MRKLLLLFLLLLSCTAQPRQYWPGNKEGEKIVFYGDSLTVQAQQTIEETFLPTNQVLVKAQNGLRANEILKFEDEVISQYGNDSGSIMVVNAGTNDAGQAGNGEWDIFTTPSFLRKFVTNSRHTRCFVFVTIQTHTFNQSINTNGQIVNDWIRQQPSIDKRIVVADLDKLSESYYNEGEPQGPFSTDTVHLTPLGYRMMVDLIKTTTGSCP